MLNQVQHDGFLYPLILKKFSVGKSKIIKKGLDNQQKKKKLDYL